MKEINFNDIDKSYKELINSAQDVMRNSYSPYSGFAVGAALLSDNGKTFIGTNVENAAYGLTICAERVAVFSAISNSETKFKALAVITSGEISTPCGSCRQVLFEIYKSFKNDFQVLLTNTKKDKVLTCFVSELLPNAFTADNLK